jgi:hypothetical protein
MVANDHPDSTEKQPLLMPITSDKDITASHIYNQIGIKVLTGNACCTEELSYILVPYLYPLSLLENAFPVSVFPGTNDAPTLPIATVADLKNMLRGIFSLGESTNCGKLRGRFVRLQFASGAWRFCCVLSSLKNGVLIVVPIDVKTKKFLWHEIQHLHTTPAPVQIQPYYYQGDIFKDMAKILRF